MPNHLLLIGLAAIVASVVLPGQAQAEHENRYFGFGYQPNPFLYNPPPVVYPPPPGVRQSAPGIYEYEVSPGRWVRIRPGYGYQQPHQNARTPQTQPAPVPQRKPDSEDDPEVAVEIMPEGTDPARSAARAPAPAGNQVSCEAAADIVKSFGFSDVQSTSCSGDVYGFDASRDGDAYSIKLSAADGELTEVRKR